MSLERLWAGWGAACIENVATGPAGECVFCRLARAEHRAAALVLEVTELTLTVMNLYPYGSGHLLIAPQRHIADMEGLMPEEASAFVFAQQRAIRALKK